MLWRPTSKKTAMPAAGFDQQHGKARWCEPGYERISARPQSHAKESYETCPPLHQRGRVPSGSQCRDGIQFVGLHPQTELGQSENVASGPFCFVRDFADAPEKPARASGIGVGAIAPGGAPDQPGSWILESELAASEVCGPHRDTEVWGEPQDLERVAGYLNALQKLEKRAKGLGKGDQEEGGGKGKKGKQNPKKQAEETTM